MSVHKVMYTHSHILYLMYTHSHIFYFFLENKDSKRKKRDLMHILLNGVAREIFEEQVYVARLLIQKKLKKTQKKE